MLYCRTLRRFPGDHAKRVKSPHGHATVSGERRLPKKVPETFFANTSLRPGMAVGRREALAGIRESGYLGTGAVLFIGAFDAEEGP